jgi:hypothetical protein
MYTFLKGHKFLEMIFWHPNFLGNLWEPFLLNSDAFWRQWTNWSREVSFLIWPPVPYMECSHSVHFSEVLTFFKLDQYLIDGLVDHKPSSYGLSKHF